MSAASTRFGTSIGERTKAVTVETCHLLTPSLVLISFVSLDANRETTLKCILRNLLRTRAAEPGTSTTNAAGLSVSVLPLHSLRGWRGVLDGGEEDRLAKSTVCLRPA